MNQLVFYFKTLSILLCLSMTMTTNAQETIYDEALVPDYTLPDPLTFSDGSKVKTPDDWINKRRGEIMHLFRSEVYGEAPGRPADMHFRVVEEDKNAFGGKATRKQVAVYFAKNNDKYRMNLLIYIPNNSTVPPPAFIGLNFYGNQAIYPDPNIIKTDKWVPKVIAGYPNEATEKTRGANAEAWPVEAIIGRGYALVTAYYGDLDPDFNDFSNGIHPLYYKEGQTRPDSTEWGAISAWAWGLSRALDYLETDQKIDTKKVVVIGHSRLGKTALWAGAQDERFAAVISNSSGCGGAALSRRKFGETVKNINEGFPWWFADNFKKYINKEEDLPIDQHELIALIAPRPVYIQASTEDLWADPKGQFLGGKFASPVYELLGFEGMKISEMPAVGSPYQEGRIGFHIRPGIHRVMEYDWMRYLDFVDKFLK